MGLDRSVAIKKLQELIGRDLQTIRAQYPDVTVYTESGTLNKGWAGHVCERYLGLQINSSRSPNFGSWELKQGSLKRLKNNGLVLKETMQLCMIDPVHVLATPFQQSHLFSKLTKVVIILREDNERDQLKPKIVHSVASFNLDGVLLEEIEADYEMIRQQIKNYGFPSLSGKMGIWVQPRTKGKGHGSTSRAFYARKSLILKMSGWE